MALTGVGYRFDLATCLTRLGAGMALLSTATLVADLILMYGTGLLTTPENEASMQKIREAKREVIDAGDNVKVFGKTYGATS